MKKALFLFSFAFCCFVSIVNAQPPCGFDQINQRLLATDPAYKKAMEETEASIQNYIRKHPLQTDNGVAHRGMATVTIPVVVHVMHTGGAIGTIYNPTDAQIQGAINYLNQVYAGTYPGMPAFSPGGAAGDMEVQFALAQRTPACGATNGIDRFDMSGVAAYVANGVNSSNTTGIDDITLKNFARWTPSDYYNVWVVNKIDGADGTSGQFVAGYAYFAGSPSSVDGTVMLATQMAAGQKTLPHEIGHALSLYHPFQGSANNTQCPFNATCNSDGDLVCDTDPIYNNYDAGTGVYSFACRSGANPCASPNNYSANTESNFMSYTNCYTLFTNGQKTRVTAAMNTSRASLVALSNLALVPCGTLINFNTASSSRAEDVTGTLTGCRRYRDYTYQLQIGTGPSAAATATLTYSGTAIKGLDYDVTTNGNFASPSNVMNFAAGSTAAQSFTVRVYDDAKVDGTNTAILDFTLNNGGGNAAKGTTAPTLTITIADNDFAPVGTSSGTFSIGTLAAQYNGAPFDATLLSQRSQYIYKASELTAAGILPGNLTAIQLFINSKASTRPFTNFTIKLGHTTANYVNDNGVITITSGMTTVLTVPSLSTAAGWNTFTFTTPFTWNGTSNVAMELCYDNGSTSAGAGQDQIGLFADGGTTNQRNITFQSGINCSQSFSTVTSINGGFKPIIRFSNSVTGTQIETAASSTITSHIDVGSNDYFYSNNGKLMMRLGNVTAPLGCVTSTLDAGGTTWVNFLGGQRSAKVYAVTPTTNTGTTSYTIALYLDNTELGGKNPNTLRLAKTTAASAAAATAGNTIVVTPTVTTLGSGTTVFTGNFTGFSRFFLIDASVTLPVDLVEFGGHVNDEKNTVLNWKTASEFNNKQFDLEISNDAVNFSLLGTVLSAGNSSSEKNYEYLHVRPPAGTSWYRLKQIDFDGKAKYSNIVAVTVNKDVVKAFIYPVPSHNKVTIDFGQMIQKASIEILSADMKVIHREAIGGPLLKKEIGINQLSKGVYFIKVIQESGTELLRFVKE